MLQLTAKQIRIFLTLWCLLKFTYVSPILFKYDIDFINEKIVTPCEEYPESTMEKFVDISNLTIAQLEDGSISLKGSVTGIFDVGNDLHPISVEILRRVRGTWQKTLYSFRRPDFCTALLSDNEVWSHYHKAMAKADKRCPFEKGRTVYVDLFSNEPMGLPDRNFEGEFNAHCEIGIPGTDTFACGNILANLYRR